MLAYYFKQMFLYLFTIVQTPDDKSLLIQKLLLLLQAGAGYSGGT
jgi:hypothetical protein